MPCQKYVFHSRPSDSPTRCGRPLSARLSRVATRPTLMITVGGITTKPRYINGNLQPRELLDVTMSVDHDLVDGAPAARFARRLADLVESADGP